MLNKFIGINILMVLGALNTTSCQTSQTVDKAWLNVIKPRSVIIAEECQSVLEGFWVEKHEMKLIKTAKKSNEELEYDADLLQPKDMRRFKHGLSVFNVSQNHRYSAFILAERKDKLWREEQDDEIKYREFLKVQTLYIYAARDKISRTIASEQFYCPTILSNAAGDRLDAYAKIVWEPVKE